MLGRAVRPEAAVSFGSFPAHNDEHNPGSEDLRGWLRHAFAVEPDGPLEPSAQEAALVDRLAQGVVRRGLRAPAILLLDCSHNLNFIASQALVFFAPIMRIIFNAGDYQLMTAFLERRGSIEYICRRIEQIGDEGGADDSTRREESAERVSSGHDSSQAR